MAGREEIFDRNPATPQPIHAATRWLENAPDPNPLTAA